MRETKLPEAELEILACLQRSGEAAARTDSGSDLIINLSVRHGTEHKRAMIKD